MKIKTLLATAFMFASVGAVTAQNADKGTSADAASNYDADKMANYAKYMNSEPEEIAKHQAQVVKFEDALRNDGFDNIPGFTYDPNVSHKVMVQSYKRALETLKKTDTQRYLQLTGASANPSTYNQ